MTTLKHWLAKRYIAYLTDDELIHEQIRRNFANSLALSMRKIGEMWQGEKK